MSDIQIKYLEKDLKILSNKKYKLVEEQKWEEAAHCRDEEKILMTKLEKLKKISNG